MSEQHHKLLEEKAFKGLESRELDKYPEYITRLKYELEVVKKLNFSTYFLVMEDIANFVNRTEGLISGAARGSGAGSLLNYCLYITKVDPIKYKLFFERFLSEHRVSPPDIDYDVNERERVIQYIEEKYGKDRVARVGSLNFIRTKSAVRDIGRALELDKKLINELAALVPPAKAGLWDSLEKECEIQPKLLNKEYEPIMEPIKKLWGVVRSYGTHAGGVAIAPGPINRFVPLYKDKDGNPVSQFDWRDLEKSGLLKFDILGLATLRSIEYTLSLLRERGEEIDLFTLPLDDEKTFDTLCQGDLDGIFQLGKTSGMKQLTMSLRPRKIEDIFLLIALYRPGPLSSGQVDNAIKVRSGEIEASYLHPKLEPILKDTYGIVAYQEQAMRVCTDICGYSGADADSFRKVIAKKLKDKMPIEREKFVKGAIEYSGFSEELAQTLFSELEGYAEYLFNLSHSAAYGFISYQTAYLKTHYPIEFYCGILKEEDDRDHFIEMISYIRDKNIDLLPPSITKSKMSFTPDTKSIRIGLDSIKGMPTKIAEYLTSEESIKVNSIEELIQNYELNANAVSALAKSGALNELEPTMNELEIEKYAKEYLNYQRELTAYNEKLSRAEERNAKKEEKYKEKVAERLEKMKLKMEKWKEKYTEWEKENARRIEENKRLEAEGKKLLKILPPPKEPAKLKQVKKPVYQAPTEPKIPQKEKVLLTSEMRTALEREMLRFYLSGHPMDYIPEIEDIITSKELREKVNDETLVTGDFVPMVGVLTNYSVTNTGKSLMGRLRFEDRTGGIEVAAFNKTWDTISEYVKEDVVYKIYGRLKVLEISSPNGEDIRSPSIALLKLEEAPKVPSKNWEIHYPLLKGKIRITPLSEDTERGEITRIVVGFMRTKIGEQLVKSKQT